VCTSTNVSNGLIRYGVAGTVIMSWDETSEADAIKTSCAELKVRTWRAILSVKDGANSKVCIDNEITKANTELNSLGLLFKL
jgi:hypothetical protein